MWPKNSGACQGRGRPGGRPPFRSHRSKKSSDSAWKSLKFYAITCKKVKIFCATVSENVQNVVPQQNCVHPCMKRSISLFNFKTIMYIMCHTFPDYPYFGLFGIPKSYFGPFVVKNSNIVMTFFASSRRKGPFFSQRVILGQNCGPFSHSCQSVWTVMYMNNIILQLYL